MVYFYEQVLGKWTESERRKQKLNWLATFQPKEKSNPCHFISVKSKLQHPPSPPATPPAFDFFENYRSNSRLPKPKCRSNAPGTLGSIQVIKRPHPRDISQAYEWQKDGRNACSFQTKSLKIQQIICIQYNKNWETLKAYLLQTKLLGKVAEITVTRSLNTQLFFVCHATYKAFYKKKIPPTEITTFHTCDIHHHFAAGQSDWPLLSFLLMYWITGIQ